MAARLHLVDGTFELYRAHYAPRPDRPKKATVGLARSLLGLLAEKAEAVTHVAIAFDNPIRSFRNDRFEGYKSDEGVPQELREQFDEAEAAARAVGVVVWSMKEFETDDALATACARYAGDFDQIRILSPDKDFGQCLRGERVVQIDRIRKKLTDEKALRAMRGFGPASVPDWLALVGDTSDGIPGLPGFGDKSAAALLGPFEHVERIPDDWRQWPETLRGREKLATTLAEGRENVALYKDLATLRTDVPLAQGAEELRFRGTPRAEFAAWCERYAAPDLAGRAQAAR
jgi:5'-3' exonuclease